MAANPERKKAQDKEYRLANLENCRANGRRAAARDRAKESERSRQWEKDNPERAAANYQAKRARKRGAAGRHTSDDIARILEEQGFKCVYCRVDITNKADRHTDHRMPLILGGSNGPENIQLLCVRCNLSKKASHPDEYERRIGFVRAANDNESQPAAQAA